MIEDELKIIEDRFPLAADAMCSGCSDYACYCHFEIPGLVAEIRRLRAAERATWVAVAEYLDSQARVGRDLGCPEEEWQVLEAAARAVRKRGQP